MIRDPQIAKRASLLSVATASIQSPSILETEVCATYTFYVTVVTYHIHCDQCNGLMNKAFTPKECPSPNGSKIKVIDIRGNYIRKPTGFTPLRSLYIYRVTNKTIQC